MRIFAAVVFACVAATAAAGEMPQTVEEVFNLFGLFGTWAPNCTGEPAPANPRVSIRMPTPGIVFEEHDLGADYAVNHYSVLSAKQIGTNRLSVEVIFQPGAPGEQRQTLEFQVRNGTRRTLFNQPEGEAPRVKGGIALASGAKTPLLRKCE